MKKTTIKITDKQREFLDTIIHEDAALTLSEAVQWCIDSCMRIEHNYDENGSLDACYIAFHDIRKPDHAEFPEIKIDPEYP